MCDIKKSHKVNLCKAHYSNKKYSYCISVFSIFSVYLIFTLLSWDLHTNSWAQMLLLLVKSEEEMLGYDTCR